MKNLTFVKKNISTIVILAIWILTVIGIVLLSLSAKSFAKDRVLPIYSVETNDKKIALTFNCAWDTAGADELLSLLRAQDINCTFFFVGSFANKFPETVRKIYNNGHEIGNHSMYHIDPVTQAAEDISKDIVSCNNALFNITGISPSLYRAPSGSYDNKTVLAAENLGMRAIQWNVDSIDWKNPTPEKIQERVINKVSNGDIVLFHLGKENTLNALPDIIKKLKEKNFEFVTVSELLPEGEVYVDYNGILYEKAINQ